MEDKASKLPEAILEWIGKYPFDLLLPHQQEEVLKHLVREEYEDLFIAADKFRAALMPVSKPDAHKKQLLLRRFDARHRKGVVRLGHVPARGFWKLAALFLLLGATWIYCYQMQQKRQSSNQLLTIDTLQMRLDGCIDSSPAKTYDTAYIEADSAVRQHKKVSCLPSPAPEIALTDHTYAEGCRHMIRDRKTNKVLKGSGFRRSEQKTESPAHRYRSAGLLLS